MKLFKKIALYLSILALIIVILNLPATTRQGINCVLNVKKIPLYAKASGFLYRDHMYRDLSRSIVADVKDDRDKVAVIYAWSVENIKRPPRDFLIIDDHVWDIVARRYGAADQMADVFTTLTDYAGYESFWKMTRTRNLVLSFVRINDTWHMFDVYNKKPFINGEDLKSIAPNGRAYGEYLREMNKGLFNSRMRRADKHRILPRIIFEIKKLFSKKVY